jgi:hypothetical protein
LRQYLKELSIPIEAGPWGSCCHFSQLLNVE